QSFASTDVGDVSWAVPTAGIATATWVPGTAAHSWQAVAASGHAIGAAGTEVAARALALAATRLYEDPALASGAREEFERRRGADFSYRPLLARAAAPLGYRVAGRDCLRGRPDSDGAPGRPPTAPPATEFDPTRP